MSDKWARQRKVRTVDGHSKILNGRNEDSHGCGEARSGLVDHGEWECEVGGGWL